MNSRSVIGRSNHVTGGRSVVGQLPKPFRAAITTKQNITQESQGAGVWPIYW